MIVLKTRICHGKTQTQIKIDGFSIILGNFSKILQCKLSPKCRRKHENIVLIILQ